MDHQEALANFVAITGADEVAAITALEATAWDLEQAVQLFFEGGVTSQPAAASSPPRSSTTSANTRVNLDEYGADGVRAPIPQVAQTLYEDDYGHGGGGGGFMGYNPSLPQAVRNVFRDFEAEYTNRMAALRGQQPTRQEGLGQLFKPPTDILFRGTFENARAKALQENKWLLVNVQNNREFVSHQLNRDTWSNSLVKTLVKTFFIFWQPYDETPEGQRFQQFYKVYTTPHICIIDPRTGERVKVWNGFVSPEDLADALSSFIDKYSVTDYANLPPPIISNEVPPMPGAGSTGVPVSTGGGGGGGFEHQSEEDMIRAAINASLEEAMRFQPQATQAQVLQQQLPDYGDQGLTEDEMLQMAINASLEESNKAAATTAPPITEPVRPAISQQAPTTTIATTATATAPAPTTTAEATPAPAPAPKKEKRPKIDYSKYIVEGSANVPDTTRLQLRFPDGKREVMRFRTNTPLAAIYEVYRDRLGGTEDNDKDFKLIFLEKSLTLEDTMSTTLQDQGILNAALQFKWENQ